MNVKMALYIFIPLVLVGLVLWAEIIVLPKDGDAVGTAEQQTDIPVAEAEFDKGICTLRTKNAGRKLLEPLYANNTPLSFETGAQCNILGRLSQNSVVMYRSPRGPDPITLKVAAMPGDAVALDSAGKLLVNGSLYKNSRGRVYILNAADQRKNLRIIASDHDGRIPAGYYFLMGDNERTYLDSSRFGMASGSDILGILAE